MGSAGIPSSGGRVETPTPDSLGIKTAACDSLRVSGGAVLLQNPGSGFAFRLLSLQLLLRQIELPVWLGLVRTWCGWVLQASAVHEAVHTNTCVRAGPFL